MCGYIYIYIYVCVCVCVCLFETNESFYTIPYNSRADVVHWLVKRYHTKSNVKLGGFRSQLQASYVSSHTEEL